jgi:hypothetical protein
MNVAGQTHELIQQIAELIVTFLMYLHAGAGIGEGLPGGGNV